MLYAIVNFTKCTTQFFADFASASAAITAYNPQDDVVYVVDLEYGGMEQL